MKNSVFISHSSYDKEVVKILSELIRKVSLNQIQVWYSNDTDVKGGFLVGENWYESIIKNLRKSHVVISFITPNSNNQPWILYESGYAEALSNCILVPVKFSINVNNISVPLQHKQIYNLSGVEDLHIFLSKLLDLFNILYDRDVFNDIGSKYSKKMRGSWKEHESLINEYNITRNIVDRLEQKFDYYLGNFNTSVQNGKFDKYEIILEYSISEVEKKEYITIDQSATMQDILDEIYYLISERVKPYTYLKSWVLLETKTQRAAIVSDDIYDWIPAQSIFKMNTLWRVVYLQKPLLDE